jgi:hypothetical protein
MIEEMDIKEEECSSQNNSFDDNYISHSNNDLFLFSKENLGGGNEFFNFETEFKKVFNAKDSFGHILKEEEEKNFEPEKNEDIRFNKKKIFKLIYNANKYVNKKTNFKTKKVFTILGKTNYDNYSFDDIILYIRKLNNSSKNSSSISNRFKILKLEQSLILELKNRILNQIKEN